MKKTIIALAATTALTTGAFAQDATTKEVNVAGYTISNPLAGVRFGNPFDKSTWWSAEKEEGAKVVVNFTDPEFYIDFFAPKKHTAIHAGFTNPEAWAQMFKIETYANMMDYTKWAKWIEPKTYAPLVDVQNYAYWMQPGAFAHDFNLDHYKKLLDVNAYGTVVDAALSNFGYTFKTPSNLLSLSDWTNSVAKAGTSKTDS